MNLNLGKQWGMINFMHRLLGLPWVMAIPTEAHSLRSQDILFGYKLYMLILEDAGFETFPAHVVLCFYY